MAVRDPVRQSAVASLCVQLLVAAITAAGFAQPTERRDQLAPVLGLELGSQLIEMAWYTWVVCRYTRIRTWTRYLDWVISTPLMIVSLALFFAHRRNVDIAAVPALYLSLVFNWAMLFFGYVYERIRADPVYLLLGTIAFGGSFFCLGTIVDWSDVLSRGLFVVTYIVWSLYGVAAALDDVSKNVGYNALDVVSKNCYGIFLFVYVGDWS